MGGCQWQSSEAPSAGHLMAEECGQRPVHPSPACLAGRWWPGAGPTGNPTLLPGGGAPGGLPTQVGQSPGATLGPRSSGITAQSPPSCPSLPDAEHLCCGLPASKGPEESPGVHTPALSSIHESLDSVIMTRIRACTQRAVTTVPRGATPLSSLGCCRASWEAGFALHRLLNLEEQQLPAQISCPSSSFKSVLPLPVSCSVLPQAKLARRPVGWFSCLTPLVNAIQVQTAQTPLKNKKPPYR